MRVTKTRFFWAYQVRRLIQSGWTEDELARALKNTPERIRQYMTGKAVPEPIAQRDLLRMISTYCKRAEAEGRPVPPRIVSDNHPQGPPPEPQNARGVYVEEVHPEGETWCKVVTSRGRIGIVHFPDELVDPGFVENLWRRLDAKDPVQTLKAI